MLYSDKIIQKRVFPHVRNLALIFGPFWMLHDLFGPFFVFVSSNTCSILELMLYIVSSWSSNDNSNPIKERVFEEKNYMQY